MSKMPSVAVLQQKKIVELTEAWNRCKADNRRLENEIAILGLEQESVKRYARNCDALLRDAYFALEHNTPSLELRERIKAAVGETETVER